MKPLLPGNPRIAYNLAAAEARLGNRDAALAALSDRAGMELTAEVARTRTSTHSKFTPLKRIPWPRWKRPGNPFAAPMSSL